LWVGFERHEGATKGLLWQTPGVSAQFFLGRLEDSVRLRGSIFGDGGELLAVGAEGGGFGAARSDVGAGFGVGQARGGRVLRIRHIDRWSHRTTARD
jgi:hypothetical protein